MSDESRLAPLGISGHHFLDSLGAKRRGEYKQPCYCPSASHTPPLPLPGP